MHKKTKIDLSYIVILFSFLFTTNISFALEEAALKKPAWLNESPKTILRGNVSESINEAIPQTGIGVIGLRFIHQSGYPTYIEEVYSNSPALKGGIREKDLIFAIDGVRTDKLSPDSVYQLLSGSPGTKVRVFITRGESMFNVELVREDLANFSNNIQNRYLSGPIAVPFDMKDILPYR